jgi:hypothetical protein
MCSRHVYISVLSTNKAPIEWIRTSDIGSCIIAPRLSCLNTVTMIALSWIQDGGAALLPCPSPIMYGRQLMPPKNVFDSLNPVHWKNFMVCRHIREATIAGIFPFVRTSHTSDMIMWFTLS